MKKPTPNQIKWVLDKVQQAWKEGWSGGKLTEELECHYSDLWPIPLNLCNLFFDNPWAL